MSTPESDPSRPPEAPAPGELPLTEAEAEHALDGMDTDAPAVGIIMDTKADWDVMQAAGDRLDTAGVSYEMRVMSAHLDPALVAEYCGSARMRGLRVIIAGAGLAAALPGSAAAHSDLPVIGVPLSNPRSAAGGLDAILAVTQMPTGVPVAAVGLDDAGNAGHLAVRILGA